MLPEPGLIELFTRLSVGEEGAENGTEDEEKTRFVATWFAESVRTLELEGSARVETPRESAL